MKEFNDVTGDKKSSMTIKKKRKNHSQLGPDFVAPDGGFGWFVCFAAGASNVRLLLLFLDLVLISNLAHLSCAHFQCFNNLGCYSENDSQPLASLQQKSQR